MQQKLIISGPVFPVPYHEGEYASLSLNSAGSSLSGDDESCLARDVIEEVLSQVCGRSS